MVTIKQTTANIWRLHEQGWWMVDPVNVYVKTDRKAVMGRGLASQILNKFPEVSSIYGELLLGWVRPGVEPGRQPEMSDLNVLELIQVDSDRHLIFFPTKLTWNLDSDLYLIGLSFDALRKWMKRHSEVQKIALPHVGAGNGKLDWEKQVKPLVRVFLESLSDEDRSKLIIVHPPDWLEDLKL